MIYADKRIDNIRKAWIMRLRHTFLATARLPPGELLAEEKLNTPIISIGKAVYITYLPMNANLCNS